MLLILIDGSGLCKSPLRPAVCAGMGNSPRADCVASIGCSAPLGQTCIYFGIWWEFDFLFLFDFHVEFVLRDSQIRRDCELLMGAQRDGRSDRGTLLQWLHSLETM